MRSDGQDAKLIRYIVQISTLVKMLLGLSNDTRLLPFCHFDFSKAWQYALISARSFKKAKTSIQNM